MEKPAGARPVSEWLGEIRTFLANLVWLGNRQSESVLLHEEEYWGHQFRFENGTATWQLGADQFYLDSTQKGKVSYSFAQLDSLAKPNSNVNRAA